MIPTHRIRKYRHKYNAQCRIIDCKCTEFKPHQYNLCVIHLKQRNSEKRKQRNKLSIIGSRTVKITHNKNLKPCLNKNLVLKL